MNCAFLMFTNYIAVYFIHYRCIYLRLFDRVRIQFHFTKVVSCSHHLGSVWSFACVNISAISTFRPYSDGGECQDARVGCPCSVPKLRAVSDLTANFHFPWLKKKIDTITCTTTIHLVLHSIKKKWYIQYNSS